MVDIETGSEVMKFENCCDVNSIASHPNLPIAVTAHEDRNIRFWDLSRLVEFDQKKIQKFYQKLSIFYLVGHLFIQWWLILMLLPQ